VFFSKLVLSVKVGFLLIVAMISQFNYCRAGRFNMQLMSIQQEPLYKSAIYSINRSYVILFHFRYIPVLVTDKASRVNL